MAALARQVISKGINFVFKSNVRPFLCSYENIIIFTIQLKLYLISLEQINMDNPSILGEKMEERGTGDKGLNQCELLAAQWAGGVEGGARSILIHFTSLTC